MRFYYFLSLLLISINAYAVCNNPISRINVLNNPSSARYNGDLDALFGQLNEVFGDCINDNSVSSDQFPDGELTTALFADASVTFEKLSPSVMPAIGRPLRIRAFTISGTWIKQADTASILVQVVGGGGAAAADGTNTPGGYSAFGSHCIAYGGGKSSTQAELGVGGSASNGDVNLQGGNGDTYRAAPTARGGISLLGPFGVGGGPLNAGACGGGAGGYCMKLIPSTSLGDSETVVVGNGGTITNYSVGGVGKKGLVLIYEYGK